MRRTIVIGLTALAACAAVAVGAASAQSAAPIARFTVDPQDGAIRAILRYTGGEPKTMSLELRTRSAP